MVTDSVNYTGNGEFLEGELPLQRTEQTTKLVLISEYNLSGTVIGLKSIKLEGKTKSGGEALLVAFKDAKASLIEWDPATHNVSTISIHFYEGEELNNTPWTMDAERSHNYLLVDPRSRCAALRFGARQLAVLPFRQAEDELADDYDPDIDGPREETQTKQPTVNGSSAPNETPYGSSFVLPLTGLDPAVTHAIGLAFLYEYRQPTLGVLFASKAPSHSLLQERRDTLAYNVFTLDIEERASTNILQVAGLPYDLHQVIPLPLPIGGTLLIGDNELVHIDQGGKSTALAVNEFAKQSSSFPMADHSDLALRLECCTVQQMDLNGLDLLLVLQSGALVIVTFKMDGRSVSGISIQKVAQEKGGNAIKAEPTCTASLGRHRVFVGSDDGDSVVVGWARKTNQLSKKRSHADMLGVEPEDELDEEIEEPEDDLYASGASLSRQVTQTNTAASGAVEGYTFRVHDTILGVGPMRSITLRHSGERDKTDHGGMEMVEIVASAGTDRAGGITIMSNKIIPDIKQQSQLESAQGIWTVHAKKSSAVNNPVDGQQDIEGQSSADADHDEFMIVSRTNDEGVQDSVIYRLTPDGVVVFSEGDFERDAGATIDVGTLAEGTRIVQVLTSEVRTFNADWDLAQMIPMEDETSGAELKILATSFVDPYMLVLRDDSSVVILKPDSSGDMEEIPRGSGVTDKTWVSGCLYQYLDPDAPVLACLLSAEGGLSIFDVSSFDTPVWATEGVNLLPPMITKDHVPRRAAAREALTEILVADIGDVDSKAPHLVLRTSTEDLVIYSAYHYPSKQADEPFTTNLRWQKVCQPHLTPYTDDVSSEPEHLHMLRRMSNVGGYSTVVMAGSSPCLILKESSTLPKVVPLAGEAVKGVSRYHTAQCNNGFAYVDARGSFKICQLPLANSYGTLGWSTRKIQLGEQVDAIAYHRDKDVFIVGLSSNIPFKLPEDDYHHEWNKESTTLLPMNNQGILKMFDGKKWTVIGTIPLEPSEVVLNISVLDLEVSEETHKRQPMVAVGTAVTRGEDLRTTGRISVFEVIDVVPEPDRPETNKKLKLVATEEVFGAVSAISEIGTQGFFLAAQGQKCMVRGLKEDGTILPTAFMDIQCYAGVIKTLPSSGLTIIGDAVRGLWLVGYTVGYGGSEVVR